VTALLLLLALLGFLGLGTGDGSEAGLAHCLGASEPSGGMGVVPGAIVLHSREEALFEGDDGAEVTFVPAPPRYVPPPCA
jgi:hypothetical protein